MTFTESKLRELLRPADPLDIPEWAAANFEIDKTSPIQGRYDLTVAPWLNEPLRDFKRAEVEDIFCMAGLQTAKTTGGFIALSWTLCEDPGPALWYHNDEQQLAEVVGGRLFDSWTRSPKLAAILPPKHAGRTMKAVQFPSSSVSFISSRSEANRTGRPARYVFGDEIKDWEPGVWETVKKRISAWAGLGKTFGFSTPKNVDDDVDKAFKEGHQAHWHVTCPHCQRPQEILWKQVEWDKILTAAGEYDFNQLLPSIRLVCAHCKAVLARCADSAEEMMQRYTLLRSGEWKAHNPGAPASKRSYTWSSLINPRVPLRILVQEYLSAKHAAKLGNYQALQDFYNQRLSLCWGELEDEEGQLPNIVEYSAAEPWSEEAARFVTADVQILNRVFALCWQWSKKGEARFVACKEILDGFPGLREFQLEMKVRDPLVFVDIGFEKTSVLTECHRFGWRGMRGEKKDGFGWYKRSETGQPTEVFRRIISPPVMEDPARATSLQGKLKKVEIRFWSNAHVKDVLQRMMTTKQIFHPPDVPAEYTKQMHSERKVKLPNGRWEWQRIGKRANHFWDCACEQVAAAICAGFLKMEIERGPVKETAEKTTA